ncbi:hypothetical protein [Rhodococcus sp. ARP2]|uniref:hypothetical protein n=1 Tax=Rhodococcus sp. ARP2 TaxID=1661385 RepID=UPI000B137EBB|nr:hypothetical protein [Rhodococcus sp. ARP2]
MPSSALTKNAPESAATDVEGNEIRTTTPMKEQESNPMLQNATDLDQWKSRAEADTSIDTSTLLDGIAARAPWADRDFDITSRIPELCGVASAPVSIPLGKHVGIRGSNGIDPAHVDVQVLERVIHSEPIVALDRWETDAKGKFGKIVGSHYNLTLDEAVQLAHTLLLAVDVARCTSVDSSTS